MKELRKKLYFSNLKKFIDIHLINIYSSRLFKKEILQQNLAISTKI